MPKTSAVPQDNEAVISAADSVVGVQTGIPQTVRFLLSQLATFFWTLANIPSGATSPITRDNESQFAFVASGLVWSGDAYASTRNASMTAGVCYINGRRISISAVVARTFTASVDTYIDILDNGDGTGTLVYTTATNNTASPVLAANSIRIGIIVTGATTIAAATSVNQGQETMVLPIASSIPYAVTDSLGNLICCRDPNHRVLGYRQITVSFTTSSTGNVQVTGLSCPVIVPTGRKVKISVGAPDWFTSTAASIPTVTIWDGVVASGTQLSFAQLTSGGANIEVPIYFEAPLITPAAASKTYNIGLSTDNATHAANISAGATGPAFIRVELE